MTYGPTFNYNHIPVDILRRFKRLWRLEKGVYGTLRAVCDSKQELDAILGALRAEGKKFAIQSQGAWVGVYCI